jgi:hypothetical protein
MASGPEHYAEAKWLLAASLNPRQDGLPYDDDVTLTVRNTLAAAQVHATLALTEATAGRMAPLVWQLDDGAESALPDLYVTRGAAVDAAVDGYKRDNPFNAVVIADLDWRRVEDEDLASELVVKGRQTGIVVRGVRPKAGA